MARSNKINWRSVDEKKLTNLVRQFNSKVGRLAKQNPDLAEILPKRLTKSSFKEGITTRQDFNRRYREYERFLKKGSETIVENPQGLKLTAWEKRENEIKARTISNARARELKRIEATPLTDRGKPTGLIRGQRRYTQAERENREKKFNFNKIRPGKEYEMFKNVLENQVMSDYFDRRAQLYKDNYFKSLDNQYGGRANGIKEMLKDVDARTIADAVNSDPDLSIDFNYETTEMEFRLQYLYDAWPNYIEAVEELGMEF